jgi:transglutaminase-like putative cysteine protease
MKQTNITLITVLLAGVAELSLLAAPREPANQQIIAREYLKPSGARNFAIEYVGKVSGVPEGTGKLRVWMPVPQDSTVQTIRELSFSQPPRLTSEPKYGNKIAYWEFDKPRSDVELTMKFICQHQEVVVDLARVSTDGEDAAVQFAAFKQPDKLVVVDDEIRKLSGEITTGKETTLKKARAIYDYVLGKMTYDKNHAGWGLGSTRHACEVGKGNCTDFHALFNSLCRAQGIASGFEIGLYLPYEKGKAEPLGGYHCWAFFRVPGKTWVPVDCSEADRFADRREFFFGGHTSNRVTLSTGRDIALEPRQSGEPLNYFLNPYAEADGKPVKTEKTWTYRDLD